MYSSCLALQSDPIPSTFAAISTSTALATATATSTTGPRVSPLWSTLRADYLARRPAITDADGDLVPDTLVGDVRKITARLSAALSLPRFDYAGLASVRAAWRVVVDRVRRDVKGRAWHHVYADNRRFWADARDLTIALAAVDQRRAAIIAVDELPTVSIAYADPCVLWADLRHWFLFRRPVRRDPVSALLFPVSTVADVAHVAALLGAYGHRFPLAAMLPAHVAQVSAGRAGASDYPDPADFWCRDSRRAIGAMLPLPPLPRDDQP